MTHALKQNNLFATWKHRSGPPLESSTWTGCSSRDAPSLYLRQQSADTPSRLRQTPNHGMMNCCVIWHHIISTFGCSATGKISPLRSIILFSLFQRVIISHHTLETVQWYSSILWGNVLIYFLVKSWMDRLIFFPLFLVQSKWRWSLQMVHSER